MFPTRHLLLFGCLFSIYISYGITSTFSRVEKSNTVSDFGENKKYMKTHAISKSKSQENQAAMSSGPGGKKHNTMALTRRSVFKKLSRDEIMHTGFHNRRLRQELLKRQMIAPGYYQAECSEKKPCKEGMYCNVLYCEKCHKLNVACSGKDQCCKGLICGFGRCEKKSKGDPGTFCEKDTDCKDACCVLEPTINSHLPICKPTLEEYHQCAAILYRKIWVGEKPDCGPCKAGLECVQKGVFGSHEVCMKPE